MEQGAIKKQGWLLEKKEIRRRKKEKIEVEQLAKRDTYVYRLKKKKQTVYIGTTNNPNAREKQHRDSGKKFTHMQIERYPTSKNTAKTREAQKLKNYRSNNKGKNPKYNKSKSG